MKEETGSPTVQRSSCEHVQAGAEPRILPGIIVKSSTRCDARMRARASRPQMGPATRLSLLEQCPQSMTSNASVLIR
jgi:hypothetical protein